MCISKILGPLEQQALARAPSLRVHTTPVDQCYEVPILLVCLGHCSCRILASTCSRQQGQQQACHQFQSMGLLSCSMTQLCKSSWAAHLHCSCQPSETCALPAGTLSLGRCRKFTANKHPDYKPSRRSSGAAACELQPEPLPGHSRGQKYIHLSNFDASITSKQCRAYLNAGFPLAPQTVPWLRILPTVKLRLQSSARVVAGR